ncbi:TIGR03086 family protein [Nocardia sp. ET3-3]|uniref:TIGR03086 family protein n=1 Tax=Nocardia terrae TaxID=2675851 RepID=A0A7K1UW88_9NOCA|nr:TIGR03086 family metal-binding protein [Nocardia terrae]MVU78656.1 TIGR03086 family protein [Nocardia terrae]
MADKAPVDPTVDLVERAVAQLGDVIAAITPDQAGLPTPCENWDVRGLLTHVVGKGLPNFVVSMRGGTIDWTAPPEEIGENWDEKFRAHARALLEEWRAADLDRLVPGRGGEVPLRSRADQQIAEFVTHAWDLTRATGQSRTLDPELAEHTLAWSKPILKPEFRGPGKPFGAELPIADDAPAYDRLAAWFGRDPHWQPAA